MNPADLREAFTARAGGFYGDLAHVMGVPHAEEHLTSWFILRRWARAWGMDPVTYGALAGGITHSAERDVAITRLKTHLDDSPGCPFALRLVGVLLRTRHDFRTGRWREVAGAASP
jgi:hypothetical protein